VAGVLFSVVVPIDHYATQWWRTLHQPDTLDSLHPLIHGVQLWTMLLSFVSFGLVYAWLVIHRTRLEQLESRLETEGLSLALAARRAEADTEIRAATAAASATATATASVEPPSAATVGGQS
jgi:heme exporter protein C